MFKMFGIRGNFRIPVIMFVPVGYVNHAGRGLIMIGVGTAPYYKFTFGLSNYRSAAADDARLAKNSHLNFNWFVHNLKLRCHQSGENSIPSSWYF